MIARGTIAIVLAIAALAFCGCDKRRQDKADASAAWDNYVIANSDRKGPDVADACSKRTLDFYTGLIKTAVEAPAQKVWELPPTQMYEVLKMRHRFKKSELKGINGRGYILLSASRGWITDNDPAWKLTAIKITPDGATATAQIHNPGWESDYAYERSAHRYLRFGARPEKPPRFPLTLLKEEGVWKIDEPASHAKQDQDIRTLAAQVRMSVRDLLMDIEADQTENDRLPMSVWDPPK
ncbi:MAG TPA: hypothetical protein PKE29_05000 [Phycisphaerales bacterium]|nr:hypothetical protein [Phycisphaerales bacterium]